MDFQYSQASATIISKYGATVALIGAYLAGNDAGFKPNAQGISTILNLNRKPVGSALKKLEDAKLACRNTTGYWVATQKLKEVTECDNNNEKAIIVPTQVVKDADLAPGERLILGFLMTSFDHSVDAVVSGTGFKKTTAENHIKTLVEKKVISKDVDGGGRGNCRHFSCPPLEAPMPITTHKSTVDPEEYEMIRNEILDQLDEAPEGLELEFYNLAVEILTEINMQNPQDELKISGNPIKISDVWILTSVIDGSMLKEVADRIGNRWQTVIRKKAYLQQSLFAEAKKVIDATAIPPAPHLENIPTNPSENTSKKLPENYLKMLRNFQETRS